MGWKLDIKKSKRDEARYKAKREAELIKRGNTVVRDNKKVVCPGCYNGRRINIPHGKDSNTYDICCPVCSVVYGYLVIRGNAGVKNFKGSQWRPQEISNNNAENRR